MSSCVATVYPRMDITIDLVKRNVQLGVIKDITRLEYGIIANISNQFSSANELKEEVSF